MPCQPDVGSMVCVALVIRAVHTQPAHQPMDNNMGACILHTCTTVCMTMRMLSVPHAQFGVIESAHCMPCLLPSTALQIAATAFVVAWAVRLGGFLVVRVWKTGHDSRFDEAKHQPFKFWIYWTMQVG